MPKRSREEDEQQSQSSDAEQNESESKKVGFSFLELMGREKPDKSEKPSWVNKGIPTLSNNETKSTSNIISRKFVENALKCGLSNEDKNCDFFSFDEGKVRDMASSFRQHKMKHIKEGWPKLREDFVRVYKKQRKIALNQIKQKSAAAQDPLKNTDKDKMTPQSESRKPLVAK